MRKKGVGQIEYLRPLRIPFRLPAEPGLVLYLPFERIFERTAIDFSPFKNNGAIYGAGWAPGKIGQALSFDGVDDYVDCGNNPSLNMTDAITIEVWINSNKTTLYDRGVVGKGQSGAWTNNAYEMRTPGVNVVRFSISNGTNINYAEAAINFNEWTHLVGVTSKAEGKIRMYKNGVLVKEFSRTIGDIQVISSPLHIGHGCHTWDGLIDEVRIYNRALTYNEVKKHYYALHTKFR
jgi:hypothetical protein